LEDDEHTGPPRTVRTEVEIHDFATFVRTKRSHTVHEVAAAARISRGTCHKILSDDLNMSRVTQHSVPRILTQGQRDDSMNTCSDLIDCDEKDGTFLNRIITGDEA
jgi:hypothetical protein